jgi:hypothetical protein
MASIEFAARAKNKIKEAKCSEMLSSISWELYASTESNFHFDQKKIIIPKQVSNFNHSLALHALSYFVSVYVCVCLYVRTFSLSLSVNFLYIFFFSVFSLSNMAIVWFILIISHLYLHTVSFASVFPVLYLSFYLSVCLPACQPAYLPACLPA